MNLSVELANLFSKLNSKQNLVLCTLFSQRVEFENTKFIFLMQKPKHEITSEHCEKLKQLNSINRSDAKTIRLYRENAEIIMHILTECRYSAAPKEMGLFSEH